MSKLVYANSANSAFLQLCKILKNDYDFISCPRGLETKEVLGTIIEITNPYDRLVTNIFRNISLKYLVGEWLWYERGSDLLKEISYYSTFWKKISDDGITANSSYGHRIFYLKNEKKISQWDFVKRELIKDQESRRAVLLISFPGDLKQSTKDQPCTIYLQFFIRKNFLHLISNMRSNDLILGFPYDIASFTMLQEKMLLELKGTYSKLIMGHYYHIVSSIHVYRRHYSMIDKILKNITKNVKVTMPRMRNLEEIKKLQYNEKIIRAGEDKRLKLLSDKFCLWSQKILLNHNKINEYARINN